MKQNWFVYMLQCRDKSLYTGICLDLEDRFATHLAGKGSKYVRSRLPAKVVFSENHPTKSSALKREYVLKRMSRRQKLDLIRI